MVFVPKYWWQQAGSIHSVSKPDCSVLKLQSCSHEEADINIFVHLYEANSKGHQSVAMRVNDSDMLILALSSFPNMGLRELLFIIGLSNTGNLK